MKTQIEIGRAEGGESGVDDSYIAVQTGYKSTSRGTFKSTLMSRGLIRRSGDRSIITPEGMSALGVDFTPLPKGEALARHWLNKLTGGELACFQCFLADYPNEVSKDKLMQSTGKKSTSIGTFVSSLRARKLVVGWKANHNLFQ